jgi:hypothetical protein
MTGLARQWWVAPGLDFETWVSPGEWVPTATPRSQNRDLGHPPISMEQLYPTKRFVSLGFGPGSKV